MHFCFLFHFLVWVFSFTGFIMLIFDFRNVAQIILSLFFWSLFCLSWVKLCFSGLMWQLARSEFNSSTGRSAKMPGTAQTGESSVKKNRNSVFRSYATWHFLSTPNLQWSQQCKQLQNLVCFCSYIFWIQHWKERNVSKRIVCSVMHRFRQPAATDQNNTSVTKAVKSSLHCFLSCSEPRYLPLFKSLFHATAGVMPKAPGSIPAKIIFHKEPQPLTLKEFLTHILMSPCSPANPSFETCHRLQKNMTHNNPLLC